MQRSINKLSSLLLIDVSQSQPIVEPRAWLTFQAHHRLVTAIISIFRFPCLKPISSWPGLIGKPWPHLHIFESVKESKIMEAGLGWKAPGGLCLLGGVLAGPAASSEGSAGKITVIRNRKEHGLICSQAACWRVQPSLPCTEVQQMPRCFLQEEEVMEGTGVGGKHGCPRMSPTPLWGMGGLACPPAAGVSLAEPGAGIQGWICPSQRSIPLAAFSHPASQQRCCYFSCLEGKGWYLKVCVTGSSLTTS